MSKRRFADSRTAIAAIMVATAALPCRGQTRFSEFPTDSDRALLMRVIAAEDARASRPRDLTDIQTALRSRNLALRRFAVRSVGRIERAGLAFLVVPLLSDGDPTVRGAAADALAQAGSHDSLTAARDAIIDRLAVESDDATIGELAESLGRLKSAADARIATLLAHLSTNGVDATTGDAPAVRLRGVVRGLYFLSRSRGAASAFSIPVIRRLQQLTMYGRSTGDAGASAPYVRTLAAMTLVGLRDATAADVEAMESDPAPTVREQAVLAGVAMADTAMTRDIVARGLRDTASLVRFRAVAVYDRRLRASDGCGSLMIAAHDSNTSVALAAIDALGSCRPDFPAARLLDSIAGSLPAHPAEWHLAAHALVSLAGAAPVAARRRFDLFLADTNFFVRTYLARAAARLRDTTLLARLSAPAEHPNVRSEAVDGLLRTIGSSGDSIYIAALSSDASQLLQSAARALSGSNNPAARPALLAALHRVSALHRETMRDARVAIVQTLTTQSQGAPPDSLPALPPVPVPTLDTLRQLEALQGEILMDNGDRVVLRFFPLDAPTNVWRFVRQARAGFFDGLTFHRVVPWFVVQGGSPEANEYMGDARFTRDELGLENRRGTVGLSTRGRDTGDGQLYVNLVDNVRLDHDYTVWGEVVSGMDAVDRMQEGARIRSIVVR